MLHFDEKGFLKPDKAILSDINEMVRYFVNGIDSETRKINFDKYIRYSTDLKKYSGGSDLKQWIDGSFVTLKVNPNDIDLVTFIDQVQMQRLGAHIGNFRGDYGRKLYGVDAYIVEVFEPESKFHSYSIGDAAYWLELFSTTVTNRFDKKSRKGFLEIMF